MQDKSLNDINALLLIFVGRLDDTSNLMLRKELLSGDHNLRLLEYAETMESDQPLYAASIVYLDLTDSFLGHGITKYYYRIVKYFKYLGKLSANVDDWHGDQDHSK